MGELAVAKLVAVGDAAPDVVLKNEDQTSVELAYFWQAQPVALVFVRHFG